MKIELVAVKEAEKSVLRQLMELYAYDFGEFDDADVNEHGLYGYTYFDYYWTEETRHPFFIIPNVLVYLLATLVTGVYVLTQEYELHNLERL